jgi:hypothetical protein
MAIKVKYLTEDEIEKDAELLLAEYEDTTGEPIKLPVPVSDITTYHPALRLGFDDLHKTLNRPMLRGQPDILGAIWVEKELVLIDRHLDPKSNPSMLGRYRFSVAHEVGHWRPHRSAQFRAFELLLEDGEVRATFRQPFDLLAQTTAIAARHKGDGTASTAKRENWLPIYLASHRDAHDQEAAPADCENSLD